MNPSLDADLMAGKSAYIAKDSKEPPDRKLLQAAAGGDEEAFTQLYHRHAGSVYNYLVRLTHDEHVGEELLQETFVAVWKGARKFKQRAMVKTWVFRIAHNLAVSWLRRHRPLTIEETDLIRAAENDSPESRIVENWRSSQVTIALEALSPTHQAVLELVFVQELSYADIAHIMECPIGTVKSRVSYALRHLNRLLSQTDFES